MLRTIDEKINAFLFVILFPFLLFFMSYYGFESSYVKLKSMEKVPEFMFSSVYAYRVIPNYLSVHITELLTFSVETYLPSQKAFFLKNGSFFYHATFLINSLFFLLSSAVLSVILNLRPVEALAHIQFRRLIHFLAVLLTVIVQYVPTNCDSIAVFCYLLGILFTLRYLHKRKSADFAALLLTVFISTFVRETACLNIAFFAAVFIGFKKIKAGNFIYFKEIVFLVAAFVLPYIGLRIMIRQEASFVEGVYLIKNFTSPFNLAGLLFGILGFYFTVQLCGASGREILKKYLFFALPYLIMITMVGLFWEARLFLPLLLTGFVAASYQFKNIQTS